jgi:hypothetical protein
MNTTNQTYKIAEQRQLIDLNGDMTNFDLTFTATSKDNKTFNIIVVDQDTIDSNEIANMQYKTASGSISGNIVADKNIYKAYYLCLKADPECEVDIKIEKRVIHPRQVVQRQQTRPPPMPPPAKKSYMTIKNVSLFCVIVIGVGLLWHFYFQKKEVSDLSLSETPILPVKISLPESTTAISPGPGGLLSKLRGLDMSP